jgi:hypothetical protein
VDTGTHPWGGEIRLRLSADEACHGCALTEHERGVSDLPWSCHELWPGNPEPSSIAATALIAGWATATILGLVQGTTPPWRILDVRSAGHAGAVRISRDPACPFHRPLAGSPQPLPVSAKSTVADLLAVLAPGDDPESWAEFRAPARCRACGHRPADDHAPAERCGRCGVVVRPAMSTRLRSADPACSLAGLGIAPEEILSIRGEQGGLRCARLSPG